MVEREPSAVQASPVSITPGYQSTIPQEWYYAGRDNEVQGPCLAEELARVFNRISQTERLEGEPVYVHHPDNTAGRVGALEPGRSTCSRLSSPTCASFRTPQFPRSGALTPLCAC